MSLWETPRTIIHEEVRALQLDSLELRSLTL